ncbi:MULTISPECIES: DUF7312 domain-containing protein [Halorussus]|uniref:DUF7312 domain-containing protein n=1 Tax=Halorussus TaxID=1070314 RepID=UPI00209CE545|nr:hypothetical protein [Halorussus vallis]USZ75146.1 hypothetical protein NGM07_17145 [Halorussus vallis]
MSDSDTDWRYDVDEVGEDDPEPPERPKREELEPGSPTAENALFVVLGALTVLVVFGRLVLLAGA